MIIHMFKMLSTQASYSSFYSKIAFLTLKNVICTNVSSSSFEVARTCMIQLYTTPKERGKITCTDYLQQGRAWQWSTQGLLLARASIVPLLLLLQPTKSFWLVSTSQLLSTSCKRHLFYMMSVVYFPGFLPENFEKMFLTSALVAAGKI
jgi:hypothetical protein